MNQSMFFVVALALCALPFVLGLSCYSCTPSDSPVNLCNQPRLLTMVNCSNDNDTCVSVKVMSSSLPPNTYIYTFGCSNGSASCAAYNGSACMEAMMKGNITSCDTTCCSGDNCNTLPGMTTPTSDTATPTDTSAPPPAVTTPSAGDKLHAYFGLLFVILMTLVWQ